MRNGWVIGVGKMRGESADVVEVAEVEGEEGDVLLVEG